MSQFEKQKKNPNTKIFKEKLLPSKNGISVASKGLNGEGEGSAVVFRTENTMRSVRGKSVLSEL